MFSLIPGIILSAGGQSEDRSGPSEIKKDKIDQFRVIISPLKDDRFFESPPEDSEILILSQLFGGLVCINPETLQVEPALAASWSVLKEGAVYRFQLDDTLWSDGSSVKAEDFRLSFIHMLESGGAAAPGGSYVSRFILNAEAYRRGEASDVDLGIRVLPGNVLELEFNRAYPFALNLLSHYSFFLYPEEFYDLGTIDLESLSGIKSSGDYTLDVNDEEAFVLLPTVPDLPGPDNILLIEADTAQEGLSFYLAGKADWLAPGGLPLMSLQDLEYRYDFNNSPGYMSYFYVLNHKRTPLNDPEFRRMLRQSLDPETLISDLLRSGQIPSHSLVPPMMYRDQGLSSKVFHSLDTEDQMIPEEPTLEPLIMIYPAENGHRLLAEAMISQWEEAGFLITGHPLEALDFVLARTKGDYHLAFGGWMATYNDPLDFLSLFLSQEKRWGSVYESLSFDQKIIQAESGVGGFDRRTLQREAEEILVKETAFIPLFFDGSPHLIDLRKWKGVPLSFPGYASSFQFLHH
jgi:oligopeptide transport system substrate-binding protein